MRLTALRASLDLAAEFAAGEQTWVEADNAGGVVERTPDAHSVPRRKRQAHPRAS